VPVSARKRTSAATSGASADARAAPGNAARAALDLLLHRYSVGPKHLCEPGPTDAEVQVLAHAALRAPDHEKRIPFRFAVVRGAARVRLGDLFEDYGRRRGKSAEDVASERERAQRSPVLIAVVARIDPAHADVPPHEQWIAVGGAIANAMNALQLLGYAGKMLSGARATDPRIAAAFCDAGETLVGWIAAGTAATPPKPRAPDDPGAIVRRWGTAGVDVARAAVSQASFGYFDHDADVGVFGRGATIERAFENAARATFALMWLPRDVARRDEVEVDFEEPDVELALVTWLNALLGQAAAQRLALADFALVRDGDRWHGRARGEPWRGDLPGGTGVKGATLTALAVRRVDGEFEARCVVDV